MLWADTKIPDFFAALIFAQIVLLLTVLWSDIAVRVIGNLTIVLIALSSMLNRSLAGPVALLHSVLVVLVLFTFLLLAWQRGMLGGGDVKLIPAVALGLPLGAVLPFLSATAMAGGVLALLHLTGRHLPDPVSPPRGAGVLRRVWVAERRRMRRRAPLPYGVAIACGAIWALLAVPAT